MLPARLHSGVLRYTAPDRMFPPNSDLADKWQASSLDLFIYLSQEVEKTQHHSADLSVLQLAYDAKLASSSHHGVIYSLSAGEEEAPMSAAGTAAMLFPAPLSAPAMSPRLTVDLPMPSLLAPAQVSVTTPDELEKQLRFFAGQINSFRIISLLHPSPQLKEQLREMEEDYEAAVRQFYCHPPSSTSDLKSGDAAQPTPRLQEAAVVQPTSGLQSAAVVQLTSGLLSTAAVQPTSGLQSAAAEPKSASTSSRRSRGRRKRYSTAPVMGGPADASAPAPEFLLGFLCGFLSELLHTSGGQPDASAPAPATEGLGDASAPAHATEGLGDASAPAHATEGLLATQIPAQLPQAAQTPAQPPQAAQISKSLPASRSSPMSSAAQLNSVPARDGLLVACLDSVPERDDRRVAPLDSVPALDDLLVACLDSVPERDDRGVAPLDSAPARDGLLVACLVSVPARDDGPVAPLDSVPERDDRRVAHLESVSERNDRWFARPNFASVICFVSGTEVKDA
ncbi:hypothetical protein CRENBAI_017861 [Crenichthys baileyi]|uniref:Uncharacterized protein n=1 Tax=Crenichthys baileyi TaxID=28760 RepID=A0AAV9RR59_9TELE